MKPNTVLKLLSELEAIDASMLSIPKYYDNNEKKIQSLYNKIKAFKENIENNIANPQVLELYNKLKERSLNAEDGMKWWADRDENGIITQYHIHYPIKDSIPFDTTLTRQDCEQIFGLYTCYGGNLTARNVANEFPKYTLAEIKRIFRVFKLTKDSSWACPHLMEELNEEQLAQYRMNLKERAAFKYCDAKMERDFTNQIKKMASEINRLRDKQEIIKSLLEPIDYEEGVFIKPNLKESITTGIICLSDLHIGAYNVPEGYIDLPEYNEDEINRRLDHILYNIQDKQWNRVIVLNLGDNVDSYRKMTSSMTHQLPCILTDKQIAEMYLRVMMRFFNQLQRSFENIEYCSIGSGNHSATWGWLLDITLSQQLYKEFHIESYVSNKEIDSIDVNDISFVFMHGKAAAEKGQFKGFPLNLNDKTQCWFNDFFADTDLNLKNKKVVLKGDLHQYSINSVSSFDYINCPSIYGSSTYIVSNFGYTKWACAYIEIDKNSNYTSGLIRE